MEKVAPEHVREQIDRLTTSQAFRNRLTLQRLLRFLGEHSLDSAAPDLKEYTVGVELFGKPESYDPQADPSARVQLGKLRQKLDEYYRTEGASDPLILEIPQRRFALHTSRRAADVPETPIAAEPVRRGPATSLTLPVLLAILAAIGWTLFLTRNLSPSRSASSHQGDVVSRFWHAVAAGTKPTTVCLATPLFLGVAGNRYRSPRIETFEQAQSNPEIRKLLGVVGGGPLTREYDFTGVGEAIAAFLFGGLFSRMNAPVDVRLEPALSWEDIKTSNVVFLGSTKFNQKLREIPLPTNFIVEPGGIRNLSPLPGEPAVYSATRTSAGQVIEDYALISRIPGLTPGLTYYLFGSRSSYGSWSTAECATKPECLGGLMERVSGGGPDPDYFEIVARVRYRDRVPIEVSYTAHRVIAWRSSVP